MFLLVENRQIFLSDHCCRLALAAEIHRTATNRARSVRKTVSLESILFKFYVRAKSAKSGNANLLVNSSTLLCVILC